jgi:ribosomal protein S15P/S13E
MLKSILSNPSKMPGKAYSLPAMACPNGAKMAAIEGTVCHKCYALKGRYRMPNVANAMAERLAMIDQPNWIDVMVAEISRVREKHFRWHDSGDLQSMQHLQKIVEIARRLPEYRFWLPTKEYALLRDFNEEFPPNLTVRVSATKIDGKAPTYPLTSTVHKQAEPIGFACEAYTRKGKCGDCRACWDNTVPNVSYPQH